MNNATALRVFAFACLLLVCSCGTFERSGSREVKKETRDKRKSPILLSAKAGDYYLNLRQNNFFDYYGLDSNNRARLYAGSYELKGDSLMMAFYNNLKPDDLLGKGLVDRANNQLILFSKDPARNRRMEILLGGK